MGNTVDIKRTTSFIASFFFVAAFLISSLVTSFLAALSASFGRKTADLQNPRSSLNNKRENGAFQSAKWATHWRLASHSAGRRSHSLSIRASCSCRDALREPYSPFQMRFN
ncbi:hypothetical protein L596_025585 [Steinernema carpocapsae]|uniref:Uncharacterized protein n=1 Tax=Steinernema carpocapsae TaxID=34508 RepID=A0A4V5ZZ41_STECR|nr:hypothetical protein L596_025585 [Steinernema carpocapsae]